MMESEVVRTITLLITGLITGAMIPIITTYLNNKSQVKRDSMRFAHERMIENEKRQHEAAIEYNRNLIKSIAEIHRLLNYFEHSTSLTLSIIDTSKRLKPQEHDNIYRKELDKIIQLKSLIISNFPDLYSSVLKIEGNYNNYWGSQRILLHIDIQEEPDDFRAMQKKVIEIANETSRNIYKLIDILEEYSLRLNEKYAT